jgi:hypothetical protein
MYSYSTYPLAGYGHHRGYGQVASLIGTGVTAMLTLYQMDAEKRARKQAEHQRARDEAARQAHELAVAREVAAAQYQAVAAMTVNEPGQQQVNGAVAVKKPMNKKLVAGAAVGGLALLGVAVAVLR